MKRKLAWVCLMVSPLVIGGTVLFLFPRDPINQANCHKIKPGTGMTEKDVISILGRAKDYALAHGGPEHDLYWKGKRGTICVQIANLGNPNEVVIGAHFMPSQPQSILEKIKDWLGL
jgi:hypothetical protein